MSKIPSHTITTSKFETESSRTRQIGHAPSNLHLKAITEPAASTGVRGETGKKMTKNDQRTKPKAIKVNSRAARLTIKGKKPNTTKRDMILGLLRRKQGATLAALQNATHWQPHSVRAVLSSIRGNGTTIVRKASKAGESVYKIDAG